MAVYKEEKTNTWRVIYRYTDWTGEKKQTQKRGFKTKREAQAWEREQLHKATADLDMSFKSFVEQYTADMKTRIKENTWATKEHIIRTKLIPYFGKLKMSSITAQQIITWQNELMNYKDDNGSKELRLNTKKGTGLLISTIIDRFNEGTGYYVCNGCTNKFAPFSNCRCTLPSTLPSSFRDVILDELSVFYVGITRAKKKYLFLQVPNA